jgi:hypothetical protein
MKPALAARLRIAVAVLAWLAQAWMPVVHATAMAAPASAHGIWCGDAAGAQVAWAALPADIQAALDDGEVNADHLAGCTLLCAFASTLPAASHVQPTVHLRAVGLEPAPADPCCPPGRPQSTTPPAQAPPAHA